MAISTRHITTDYKDETGVLLQALMAMKTRLLDIVQEVQTVLESISTAAAQIVAGNRFGRAYGRTGQLG